MGAGPSGLMSAHTLARLGYRNVTVFERNDRVGGKVHTFDGVVQAELGALLIFPDYEVVLGLADELGVPYLPDSQRKYILDENGALWEFQDFLRQRYDAEEIAVAMDNYAKALETFASVGASYTDLHPDLTLTFDAFVDKYDFEPVARLIRSRMVGFGFAYYEQVPAAYYMKIIGSLVQVGESELEAPPTVIFPLPKGFQALWEAVADPLDVRLNAEVTKISRAALPGGRPITVTINGQQELRFDRVIISAPLPSVADFLDVTDEERDLFERVRSNRFFVTVFAVLGLTNRDAWFFDANSSPDRINHVAVWTATSQRRVVSPNFAAPVFTAYQVAEWQATDAEVAEALRSDVSAAGGVVAEVLVQAEWPYFPHVGSDDLAAGFYDRVEALQGQLGTYYVGSGVSIETVEHAARYARDLVMTHFPDRNR
ncbi:MAG: FAD-dependent oxidoreductase [Deltaproteobacteria bacterium]|nr:FAD-dependent oxidoreductase [Deltaproteobacteria bacterium]MBW2385970.1 FAD-dependent oxidoreductase [Deltaproteobacteria bacterium]